MSAHATVTKTPDGTQYITKDGHGDLFAGELTEGKAKSFGDNSLQLIPSPALDAEEGDLAVEFSWVDYMDTSTPGVPHPDGVRHTKMILVPGRADLGPYQVEVSIPDGALRDGGPSPD